MKKRNYHGWFFFFWLLVQNKTGVVLPALSVTSFNSSPVYLQVFLQMRFLLITLIEVWLFYARVLLLLLLLIVFSWLQMVKSFVNTFCELP